MSINETFCLSGWGYLHDVVENRGKFIAVISVLTHPNADLSNKDYVQLDCEVNNDQQKACLKSYLDLVHSGKCIMLNFIAGYETFSSVYSGQRPNDPKQMVVLQAKLHSLKTCLIDGIKNNIIQLIQ